MVTFSGLQSKIKPFWLTISGKKSKNTSAIYYQYHNIPLRVYFDIASSGDYSHLLLSGKLDDQAEYAWDEIIQENTRASGSNRYQNYLNNKRAQVIYYAEYLWVVSLLQSLQIVYDEHVVKELATKNYMISRDPEKYQESIGHAFERAKHLLNKIKSKQNEFAMAVTFTKGSAKNSFTDALIGLNYQLGWEVSREILLSEYNKYREQIREEIKLKKKNGR